MKMFSYEIHDSLKEIRGKRRIDQLHLACLLTACFCDNFSPLMMSNTEYAMNVLRSTISNKPLSTEEMAKLVNILDLALEIRHESLILLCRAVYLGSNILKFVLPFNNEPIPQK